MPIENECSLTGGASCVADNVAPLQFKVIKEISRGTFSTVCYCEGGIALKTMSEQASPQARTIYLNDLTVLRRVAGHPNIVRLLGFAEKGNLVGNLGPGGKE